jgi:hypothetical protein
MRASLTIATLVTLLAGFNATAKADPYPWCAVYGMEDSGSTNCYFMTLQQCQATISGVGGFCTRNNFYDGRPVGSAEDANRRAKKREPH